MKKLILLFIVPAIFAFKAQFKYGCGSESCTYKFVIPEVVAHYVNPKVLKEEVEDLQDSIKVLKKLQEEMPEANTKAFDEAFEKKHNDAAEAVLKATETVDGQKDSFANAVAKTAEAKKIALCLAGKTNCFESGKYSDDCGKVCDH
ncbi:hypothetical protein Y032_0231g3006 [Ancylostoma ceylanicum]|uniref:DUF148 domain-containing protein n=1 Tax=Ancylostoma ceylanicum TaxID=53326 RepID=A0A016SGR3_9BILA|nr:hypothetical protein Y032_0231g3006 [Ancylostoma ceylanicum]